MAGVIQYRYDTSDDVHQIEIDEGEILTEDQIIDQILSEVFGDAERTCNLKCLNPGGNPLVMQRTFHQRFKPKQINAVSVSPPVPLPPVKPPPKPVPIPIPGRRKRRWRSRSPTTFRPTRRKRWVSPPSRRGYNNNRRRKRNRRF